MAGSHVDTQPSGGKFRWRLRPEAQIEVAAWTNEEGSRYTPVMMGSGAFAGVFALEYALARTDAEGKAAGDELARIGYAGSAPLDPGREAGPVNGLVTAGGFRRSIRRFERRQK